VLVCGTDPAQAAEFAKKMSEKVRLPVESADAEPVPANLTCFAHARPRKCRYSMARFFVQART